MAAQRGFTSTYALAQTLADKALNNLPEGVTIEFKVSRGITFEDCKSKARSLQQSFAALRARERRLVSRRNNELNARDLVYQGEYDKLACFRENLPDDEGTRVIFTSAQSIIEGLTIIDNKTGEPFNDIGADASERVKLFNKVIFNPKHFTAADWDRLTELDAIELPGTEPWHTQNGVCKMPRKLFEGNRAEDAPTVVASRDLAPASEEWGTIKDADLDALRESGDIFGDEG